ncbi:EcsC family protein [Phormidium sp. LEGE 05292]|uniref:EcsC family protein n=1 Tax=[Phormidium] sp. LEGE 05292 TaxID=767427 RepID=UPI0018802CF0|nr:EcsC family protein [Phormidium sp. LEGE 05292]MBE9225586.1 EcsC family protein [Phormidium sp. LEGE 05292]
MNKKAIANVEFKVIHKIPGRIRLEIPMLKSDDIYRSVLEKLLESTKGVTGVRINPIASSIVIKYDRQTISETDLNCQISTAIKAASNYPVTLQLNQVPIYEVIQLTEYETNQFKEILDWLDDKPFWLTELLGYVLSATKGLISWIIPDPIFTKIGAACERAMANWQQDWQELKPQALVEDYHQLRYGDLEKCDRLAAEVAKRSLKQVTAEGGITEVAEIFGEILNDGLAIVLALRTIHRIGLCYGYAPENVQEKAFAWGVFNVGIAQTQQERQEARKNIGNLRLALDEKKLEKETLENSIEEDADDLLIDSTIEQALTALTEETAGGIVPVLSIFLGLWADRSMISEISTAAKREFQLRWLLDNQKIACVNSDLAPMEVEPPTSRSQVQPGNEK